MSPYIALPHAKVIELPEAVGESGDVTDFFVRLKRSAEEFSILLNEAQPVNTAAQEERPRRSASFQSTDSLLAKRIGRIKSAMPIADIVGQYVNLRPSGRTLVGRCPFHDDRTPSFVVYPHSETFHCFGCRAHGDVISFIQQMEGMSFGQALEALDPTISANGNQPQQNQPTKEAA